MDKVEFVLGILILGLLILLFHAVTTMHYKTNEFCMKYGFEKALNGNCVKVENDEAIAKEYFCITDLIGLVETCGWKQLQEIEKK